MHKNYLNKLFYLGCTGSLLLLGACAQTAQNPAPIVSAYGDARGGSTTPATTAVITPTAAQATAMPLGEAPRLIPNRTGNKTHIVQPGENLYRISLNNGLRHQDVARWNGLEGFDIKVGQVLKLSPPQTEAAPAAAIVAATPDKVHTEGAATSAPVPSKPYPKALKLPYSDSAAKELASRSEGSAPPAKAQVPSAPVASTAAKAVVPEASAPAPDKSPAAGENKAASASANWIWPTEGKIVGRFSEQNKGLDIAGRMGQPVVAAGDGKVVYSGSGLKGYGKLIIIKHDKEFLSAYAHNSELLVKEGQSVKKGQRIANMGNSDADQVKLHFEIREFGKPVNPENHLTKRS